MKKITIICFTFLSILPCFSQQKTGILTGIIYANNTLLSNATIQIDASNLYAVSTIKGKYSLSKIPYGKHMITVSFIGLETIKKQILINKATTEINFSLKENQRLQEVIITATTKEQSKQALPVKVSVINIEKIQERSISLANIINQTAGVKIRQTSGVGSDYEVNINGLQGKAIRYFKNNIPTDYLGRAFQLNLIPTGNIANIEIYKGMLPVHLGADALGGAINIRTKKNTKNYVTTSYEIGSFATHKGTLNANYCIAKTNIHIGINSYAISSKNNYKIDAPIRDLKTQKLKTVSVNRFHDAINTQLVQANFGIHNSSFSDVFDIEVSAFNYKKELQHGYNLANVFGEVEESEQSKMMAITYKKLFFNKLSIDLFYANSNKNQKLKDTSNNTYDWFGHITNIKEPNFKQGEVKGIKINQSIDEKINTGRFFSKYKFTNNIDLKVSTTLSSKFKQGTDPYSKRNAKTGIQPITLPSTYLKIVSSAGVGFKLFDKKLHNEFVIKSFNVASKAYSLSYYRRSDKKQHNSFGFGNALKYKLTTNSYMRFSYEKSTRIPVSEEYFGDNLFTVSNPKLVPEKSNNYNLGIHTAVDTNTNFLLDLNVFYRKTEDFIRLKVIGLNLIHENADTQIAKGLETTFTANLKNALHSKLSLTYQDLRTVNTATALDDSRIANVPYFFTNFNVSKKIKNLFNSSINVDLYTDYSFTEQYLLLPISKALEPKLFERKNNINTLIIPEQHQLDMGFSTKHTKLPITFNFQINNVLNLKLYDQFKIQKPTRNIKAKITYKF